MIRTVSARPSRRRAAIADSPPSRIVYLDASAAVKLVREEPESAALRDYLGGRSRLLSSALLETEVRRAVRRFHAGLPRGEGSRLLERVAQVLTEFTLFEVRRELLLGAGSMEPAALRSLDAIHLATALSFPSTLDAFLSYDARQLEAAARCGLAGRSPGAGAPQP